MKIARILSIGVVALLIGGPAARAQGRSPSPLETFSAATKQFFVDTGAGTKRFFAKTSSETKRFFAGTRNALTWKRPAGRRPAPGKQKRPKRSWLDSLLGRQEPKPIRSLDDWWELERMDP